MNRPDHPVEVDLFAPRVVFDKDWVHFQSLHFTIERVMNPMIKQRLEQEMMNLLVLADFPEC